MYWYYYIPSKKYPGLSFESLPLLGRAHLKKISTFLWKVGGGGGVLWILRQTVEVFTCIYEADKKINLSKFTVKSILKV